ncbi:LacI family DNA-binding transcriptional regulator [Streptomyces radicis]|uniref:LacI family DNA-binding transcriptional regulator n=1 Tax=Streptomyces radicis TaxID=1750517 RepID=UPI001C7D4D09|nr:LacI family DNA-binding transcriptional regulator [Streptomyces radicis]
MARLAGVSHQTVSRYLRGERLKPATREKVDAAVKDLDYRPNQLARSMRTRRTNRLAVVLPMPSTFPLRLLSAASATAHKADYELELVSVEGGSEARSDRVRELAESGRVEGILSLASLDEDIGSTSPVPVLTTGDYDDQMRGLGLLADGSPVVDVIEYLVSLGHQDFLHVAGSQSWASARNRKRVYLETIERLGLRSHGVVDGNWSARSGYDAIVDLPDDTEVTAVVAVNDTVAMGVVRGALSRRWQVPRDLSVFGWDDDEIARFATPSLSTIAIDREAQGRDAMLRLIAAIRGEPVPESGVRSINRLVPRESTGRPRQGPAPARQG